MNEPEIAPLTAALFARKGDASTEGFVQPEPATQRRATRWNRGAYAVLTLPVAYLVVAVAAVVSLDLDNESQPGGSLNPVDTISVATAMKPPAIRPAPRVAASVQPVPLLKPVSVSIPVAPPLAKRIRRTPPPPTAKGRYRVQLASLGSAAAVRREWARLKSTHGEVFRGLRLTTQSGPSNAFYRLQAGPVASRAAARKLCAKLGRPRTGCFIVTK